MVSRHQLEGINPFFAYGMFGLFLKYSTAGIREYNEFIYDL